MPTSVAAGSNDDDDSRDGGTEDRGNNCRPLMMAVIFLTATSAANGSGDLGALSDCSC